MAQILFNGMESSELLSSIRGILSEELSKFLDNTNTIEKEEYAKPNEICREFKISKPTFYDWLKKGKFPIYKIGNLTYVKRSEFLKALVKVDLNPIYPK